MQPRRELLKSLLLTPLSLFALEDIAFARRRRCGRRSRRSVAAWDCPGSQVASAATNETSKSSEARSEPEVVQPDPLAWQQITRGLAQYRVIQLLGQPHERLELRGSSTEIWIYGRIKFHSEQMPDSQEFYLLMSPQVVTARIDPFQGAISPDGVPTVPVLILPQDQIVCGHFPRILDLRWHPSAGHYPLQYQVEVEDLVGTQQGYKYMQLSTPKETAIPFITMVANAKGAGRWRVRAENEKGMSPWSDYFHYEFTI